MADWLERIHRRERIVERLGPTPHGGRSIDLAVDALAELVDEVFAALNAFDDCPIDDPDFLEVGRARGIALQKLADAVL